MGLTYVSCAGTKNRLDEFITIGLEGGKQMDDILVMGIRYV
jgi:hypothetical protein